MECNLISCSNNSSKTQCVNIFDTQSDTVAKNCAPCQRLRALWVNLHMESEGGNSFRPPDEPGPSFCSAESARLHCGKRRGAGRKRQHEGCKKAQSTIWKIIALHKNVNTMNWLLSRNPQVERKLNFCFYSAQEIKMSYQLHQMRCLKFNLS